MSLTGTLQLTNVHNVPYVNISVYRYASVCFKLTNIACIRCYVITAANCVVVNFAVSVY